MDKQFVGFKINIALYEELYQEAKHNNIAIAELLRQIINEIIEEDK